MHEMDRSGQITGTTEQLARLCRCTAVNFVQALEELKATNTATVTERNGKVTVINRRMKREERERKSRNERALRYRQKMKRESNAESDGESNAKVTCISSSSSSSSIKENNIKEKITFSFQSGGFENITSEDILAWSEAYPAVDVQLSIKQAAQWLISNPSKLKKNYRRFLANWFARTQEKGGNKNGQSNSNSNYRPSLNEQDWGQALIPN